jgi:hypothetical protein
MFKAGCLQLLDAPPECSDVTLSIDSAFKLTESADFTVVCVLGSFAEA